MSLDITAIGAFEDNYIWALSEDGHCVLVDPGQAAGALEFLERGGLELAAILLTHHHPDHIGGVDEILAHHPAPVHGPDDPRMPAATRTCADGDRVMIDTPALRFEVIKTPGHTTSHIAFYGNGMLLCGDTLFSAGCGRLFEGTPAQMQATLDRLAELPNDTRVYCGHEYSLANCRFAGRVEPDNPWVERRTREVERLRAGNRITLPSTLGDEKRFNPFLRTREPAVIEAARRREPECDPSPASVFGVIRRWKDAA